MNHVSLVEQLKELVKAQNESLRSKEAEIQKLRAENARLVARVRELENEKDDLKASWEKYQQRFRKISKEEDLEISTRSSHLNDTGQSEDSSLGELYSTALTSPSSTPKQTSTASISPKHHRNVTVTLASSTPTSASKNFLGVHRHDTGKKLSLSRSDSRKAKRKSYYELSPDISDKHVQILENCYGGKDVSNHAARVIQQHYRNWSLQQTYSRLRAQSEVRRTSWKGRAKRNSLRRQLASDETSTNSGLPSKLDFSSDNTDGSSSTSCAASANMNSKTTKPEENPSTSLTRPKDEFKAIQTDLNIDENFQPVEVVSAGERKMSIRNMSEDISSIEISKNLLNDSIGQKMIIDEVFQQILSPRKDSISLHSGRSSSKGSLKSVNEAIEIDSDDDAADDSNDNAGVMVNDKLAEDKSKDEDKPTEEDKSTEEGKPTEEEDKPAEEEGNVVDSIDGVKPVRNDVSEEKPNSVEKVIEKEITNSNENLPAHEENDKFSDNPQLFGVADGHAYSWPTLDQLHGDDTTSMGGVSLSPSSSIIQTFYEDKAKDIRIGVNYFNRKPKNGISYLIETEVLDGDAESVCKFLREEPGINKQKIGEYLGDLRNPLSMAVLQTFVRSIDVEGKPVDEALRYFQTFFRMPGEAQKIERVVEEFSAAFVEANSDRVSNNPDTILILSFAIIMLNTDLHSPNVKRKMSKVQFVQNLRGTDNGEDLPYEILSDIYDRVQKKQFKTGPDNLDAVMKYEKQILGKVPWTTLALPHRQLRQVTTMYEVHGGKKKEKAHHRVIFLFNDMVVVTKERGQAGQKGIHFYSFKCSHSLCDLKFSLFNNSAYKFGIRLFNKSNNKILLSFNAKKEDIRKAFYTELKDCIEETTFMESDRINFEKSRQLTAMRFGKRDLEDSISLTLPRQHNHGKMPADSLSLVNEPGVIAENDLQANKILSSSLQDLSLADDNFFEENLLKSNSVTSFERMGSVSTENVWSHYQNASDSTPELCAPPDSPDGHLHLPKKFGLFSSKRAKTGNRKTMAKSTGSLEDIKALQRSAASPRQRKSEFFVKSPIAT